MGIILNPKKQRLRSLTVLARNLQVAVALEADQWSFADSTERTTRRELENLSNKLHNIAVDLARLPV